MRPFFLFALSWSTLVAQTFTIKAGLVLDGKGGVLRNQQITIQGSRIVRIENGQTSHRPADVDLRRFTVMPGWIDTHVHLDWHFGKEGKIARQPNQKPEELALYDAENAWLTLQGGFTTVQSVGSGADVPVRDHIIWAACRDHAFSPPFAKLLKILEVRKS